MLLKLFKATTVSFILSLGIVYLIVWLIGIVILKTPMTLEHPIISIVGLLSSLYIFFAWPVVQTSLLKFFSVKFGYFFKQSVAFYTFAALGFSLCFWSTLLVTTRILNIKEVNFYDFKASSFHFGLLFIVYLSYMYLITASRLTNKSSS